jgi:Cof subfamily protein (haloacid dehalogenase superfamily)
LVAGKVKGIGMELGLDAVQAVAVDVDGTLANADHEVSERTLTALRAAQDAGLLVVVLTGRARKSAVGIAQEAGLRTPVICCNGALIIDPTTAKTLRTVALPDDEVRALLDMADELDLMSSWWSAGEMIVSRADEGARLLELLNDQSVVVADPTSVRPGSVLKAMVSGTGDELDKAQDYLLSRLPRLSRSMDQFFEISPAEAGKWQSLQYVLNEFGIEPGRCLGFGDGGNDVPWLREIGHPVAVANAREEVKAVARYSTGHHADDGVATFLEELLNF